MPWEPHRRELLPCSIHAVEVFGFANVVKRRRPRRDRIRQGLPRRESFSIDSRLVAAGVGQQRFPRPGPGLMELAHCVERRLVPLGASLGFDRELEPLIRQGVIEGFF
jgi:hypothetical protein